MFCVCLLGFLWVANRQNGAETSSSALYLSERGDPPLLAQARQAADARPEDPNARLDLASAYHAREMDRQAVLELMKAGELFLVGGAYPEALRAFADALTLRGGPEGAEPAAVDLLQQAVFLGAPDEGTWETVERLLAAYPDWDPLTAAASRTLLHQDRFEEARGMAEGVLSRKPEDAVAMVALLETLIKIGDPAAREATERARNLPRLPEWLRPHLERLLQAFPGA
jgi:thioredoxin-like negative regulator of GroEL